MQNLIAQFLSSGFIGFLLFFLFCVCMFFIVREITTWYFKINENTETLKSIDDSLRKIAIAAEFSTTDLLEKRKSKALKK